MATETLPERTVGEDVGERSRTVKKPSTGPVPAGLEMASCAMPRNVAQLMAEHQSEATAQVPGEPTPCA